LIINVLNIANASKTRFYLFMSESIQNLFQEFEATTKAQWLARVERDLKGKSLSELAFTKGPLSPEGIRDFAVLNISPFAHADDFVGKNLDPIIGNAIDNAWAIGENIDITKGNFKAANQQALTALMGGANALFFTFDVYPIDNQLYTLLENIEFEYIESHFHIKSDNSNLLPFLENLKKIILKQGKNLEILRGSVSTTSNEISKEVLLWIKENLPLFKIITIDGSVFHKGSEYVIEELTEILLVGEKKLNYLKINNLDINLFKNNIQFNVSIGINYFIEIAKIRALKLLWGNVLKAYEMTPSIPIINAKISKDSFVEDAHKNKISVTTQAMSAVLAGVESLTIDPTEDSNFGKRISRNVQHLLQLESYLDRVADPSAGSYYIEQLTNQIAENVWQRFREKV
jgi:methylmalonyl-CoA mutase